MFKCLARVGGRKRDDEVFLEQQTFTAQLAVCMWGKLNVCMNVETYKLGSSSLLHQHLSK